MEFTLVSGVMRNRKVTHSYEESNLSDSNDRPTDSTESHQFPIPSFLNRLCGCCFKSNFIRNFSLRLHKFKFKWDLVFHLAVCLSSLTPFAFSGNRLFAIIPLSVWLFYNFLFLIGSSRANSLVPGFSRFKHAFTASIEEFFSAKLLPVISVSFLLVVLLLSVTGRRLGGPPLCYSSCHVCLAKWSQAIPLAIGERQAQREIQLALFGIDRTGCGYTNGKELLGYYTIAQTSYIMFVTVLVCMAVCMAWRVAEEELGERQTAEDWLKREEPRAFEIRDEIMKRLGTPGSYIRPEGNAVWVSFGVIAALTFTLLGWHNWYMLPPSHTATLLILLNLLTILTSMLILHLSFFGRMISLYQRNFLRVRSLSAYLASMEESQLDAWWNCRTFILSDDLGLDYDSAGLSVSATFLLGLTNMLVLSMQLFNDGFEALLEPPGSYCAYACLYFTMCLIRVFTIATHTFEEQHKHISGLHQLSMGMLRRGGSSMSLATLPFDYYTHSNPLPSVDMPVSRSHSVDYEQYCDTASEAESEAATEALIAHYPDETPIQRFSSTKPPLGASSHISQTSLVRGWMDSLGSAIMTLPASASFGLIDIAPQTAREIDPSESNSKIGLTGSAPLSNKSFMRGSLNLLASRDTGVHSDETHSSADPATNPSTPRVRNVQVHGGLPMIRSMSSAPVGGLGNSSALEARRSTITEMISQIRKYDPYPLIFGIPVMPALFSTCKLYIFICFTLIGTKVMFACLRILDVIN